MSKGDGWDKILWQIVYPVILIILIYSVMGFLSCSLVEPVGIDDGIFRGIRSYSGGNEEGNTGQWWHEQMSGVWQVGEGSAASYGEGA